MVCIQHNAAGRWHASAYNAHREANKHNAATPHGHTTPLAAQRAAVLKVSTVTVRPGEKGLAHYVKAVVRAHDASPQAPTEALWEATRALVRFIHEKGTNNG
jgi:uncharacterized membrane protein